jgi:hypothetical protein
LTEHSSGFHQTVTRASDNPSVLEIESDFRTVATGGRQAFSHEEQATMQTTKQSDAAGFRPERLAAALSDPSIVAGNLAPLPAVRFSASMRGWETTTATARGSSTSSGRPLRRCL